MSQLSLATSDPTYGDQRSSALGDGSMSKNWHTAVKFWKKTKAYFMARNRWVMAATLCCCFGLGFLSMPKDSYLGDPYAMREEARNFWLGRGFRVPASVAENFGERGQYFVVNPRDGEWHSKYGLMTTLINVIPLGVEKIITGELQPEDNPTRIFLLNLFFLAIHVLLAWTLFELTGFYTKKTWIKLTFVGCTLYCTFLWNYLRAHNSESLQVLFFSLSYLCFLRFQAAYLNLKKDIRIHWQVNKRVHWPLVKPLYFGWLCVLGLVLTKISYIVLVPFYAASLLYLGFQKQKFFKKNFFWYGIETTVLPGLVMVGLVCLVSWTRFGSPFVTGYHQWRPDVHNFSAPLWAGLSGFLFSRQWSIFVHFPVLFFALFGLTAFYKRNRTETFYLGLVFIVFVVLMAKMPNWKGESCYGPRYLLFMLPVMALPSILLLERIAKNPKNDICTLMAGVFAVVMALSAWAQVEVNRLDFFAYYFLRPNMAQVKSPEVQAYFNQQNFAQINWDFRNSKDHLETLPVVHALQSEMKPREFRAYLERVHGVIDRGNYYWF